MSTHTTAPQSTAPAALIWGRVRSLLRTTSATTVMMIAATAVAFFARPSWADAPSPYAVYAFAQQKIYGMTLTPVDGANATLVGDPLGFAVKMSTAASVDSFPGVGAHNGGLDAEQSFIGSLLPGPAPENWTNNAPAGYSIPTGERVLQQWNPTGTGGPKGITVGIPVPADFSAGHNFARSDAYTAPQPDPLPPGPASATIPANVPPGSWPPVGSTVNIGHLFAPIGSPDTLSIDLVAETLLTDVAHGTISDGVSDWAVTGKFSVVSTDPNARCGVSLDFNVVERMAVYSVSPLTNIATCSNEFSFDVLDSLGNSVFGGLLGSNPSIARLLSSPATGSETYNNNTNIPTHIYPGPGATSFQTVPLPPGDYSFTIKGTSTAYVSALPEPGMNAALAIVAAGGAAWWRRRRPGKSSDPAPRN
ncbi:MAG: hypothetical protein KGR24_10470 [Planctomycetes bacterium]|nr:hypothetical protein [Planctomycetota bacterium]